MKQTIYLAMAIAMMGMASCGNKVEKKDPQNAQTIDSAKSEELTKKEVAYFSDDLKMLGLRGRVKNVSEVKTIPSQLDIYYLKEAIYLHTFSFNTKGKLVEEYVDPTVRNTVNEEGYLVKHYSHDSDATQYNLKYKELNENGWPIQSFFSVEGPFDDFNVTYKYEYTKTDSCGNWIERKVSCKGYDMDEETGEKNSIQKSGMETRKITYYE